MKANLVRASRVPASVRLKARARHTCQIFAPLLFLGVLALPRAALADGCTPVTSTASPIVNSIVACTGVTLNQNAFFGAGVGYGTFNETGNTIDVQTAASVTGDFLGFGLADGNTVNNSGAVTGGSVGINTTTGSTITVNNLTAAATISGTTGEGLDVTNVVLDNAGTITGEFDGVLAVGNVTLTSNTGSITASDPFGAGISAVSVSGSNAGTISGAVGIDTHTGTDVNLDSNSGTIQGNNGFGINSGGNVVIGINSGSITAAGFIARAITAVGTVTTTNTGSITASGQGSQAIVANGDVVVTNSGNVDGEDAAINAQSNSSTSLNLTNNIGGSITSGSVALEAIGTATIINGGTLSAGSLAVNADTANITNNATGIIEATGASSTAIGTNVLSLTNAGIVRDIASVFAIETGTIETGSTNSGMIIGNQGGIAADDLDMMNSGTITGGILAIQVTNTATLANLGTISGDRRGIVADDVEITNSGTIIATGGSGLQAFGIITLTGNITNTASGIISATGTAVNNDAINTADTTTVDNSGTISSSGRSGVRAGGNATIINESGGTITGVTGIVIRDAGLGFGAPVNSSVFNAGTITGTGGTAINFAFTPGAGPMTLTLAPGSVINGLVLGTGADTFQLGGKGSDTFDVDNIGATQQYQGFVTFNKTGGSIWTLTGTGTQSWTILSGTLIGDTNTFGADIVNNGTIEFKQDFDGTFANVISGSGNFVKDGTGVLELANDNTYTGGTTISSGTLVLGRRGFGFGGSIVGDVADNGELEVNRPDSLTLSGVISGVGSFVQAGSGVTTLTGANTYTGGTFVNNGMLQLGDAGDHGAIAGPISVSNGASLNVVNADFSQVTMVTLDSGSALFELSTNAGTAQITATNNSALAFFDNATAGQSQISLDNSTAGFQDSASAGNATISAGNGSMVVFLGSSTAANSTIGISGPGSLVFFGSSTAANTHINSSGMNAQIAFEQNSTAAQATIVLSQPGVLEFSDMASADHADIVTTAIATVEFVGSSTAANARIDATVGGVILFDNASADHAQITLGGNATLIISDGASGGSAAVTTGLGTNVFISGLTNGGTTLASLNGAGNVVLGSNTLTIGGDNSDSTISGPISGLGGLSKTGSGKLTLSGNNFFSGVTTISGGTLQVGDGGSTGNIGGDVVDNAALVFDLSGFVTVPGAISGSGSLAQIASGTTILTGTNTYSGGTTITSGTLQIGGAGTTGSIIGDVLDNGTLAFDRSDDVGLTGVISGSGSVALVGGGTVTLTGANTYTGGTVISSGVLVIGNGGTTGSIVGDVVDNSRLVVDRSDFVLADNVVSGTGALVQAGSGVLALVATDTFTGGTTINSGGTLQIGNGGTSGSIVGDVADNGTLGFDRSDNLTFAGAIFGSGGLTQIGSGTLTLTGTNTYIGGTTISSGTLQLGTGGTSGSIIGDVVNDGTLVFDRSDSVIFPGAISGSGNVVQNGSGTLILTATSSYTGTTTVNAGILDVNGSISSSAVTVNRSTTLKGNGTVGPLTLAAGSTVAPGNSIGTLHVAGAVSFAAGSTYSVELNPAGQSDLIAATGAATIASGALVQITAAAGTYAPMTHYVILTATGGVTGTFDTPTINLPFLVPELIYQPNEVDLLLTLKDINLIPPARTQNQIATAVAVRAGGPQSVIFGQFLQDSENGLGFVTSALDQLSGEIHPSLVTEELEDSRVVQLSIMQRLRQTATGDVSGMLAPASEAREIVDGISIWTHAFADWGTFESDGNVATLDQNLSGILAGIDARIGAGDIGFGGGYSHSHVNQRTSVAKGGNGYVAAYGGWTDDAVALRAGATYGWGNRNILRTVTFPGFSETLTSKEDQHVSQVFGEVGYALNMEHVSLEPFAGITWDDASTGRFAEQGGAAALSGRGGDTSVAYSSLGVRLAARPMGSDALSLTPRASLAWQHAFGGLHPGQVLTFEDTGQSFRVLGSVIDTDSADVALGFDAQIGSGGTLSLGYEGILSSRVRLNTLHAGLNWNF